MSLFVMFIDFSKSNFPVLLAYEKRKLFFKSVRKEDKQYEIWT